MTDSITVDNSGLPGAPRVATKIINGIHYPRYIQGVNDFALDVWGNPKVVQPVSIFHGMWTFDIPQSMWLVYEDDVEVAPASVTGCVSSGGGASLDTGLGGAGTFTSVLMTSKRHPRYQPNRGHRFATALYLPDAGNDGTAEFGLFSDNAGTIENGCFFRLEADGTLSAVVVSNSVETYSQTIVTSGLTDFDATKGNLYDLRFQWRGVGDYFWYINQTLVHQTSVLGYRSAISMQNPALPASYKVTNTTEDQSILVGCVDVESEGGIDQKLMYNSASNEKTTGGTGEVCIVSIYSPPTISGNENTRDAHLVRVNAYASAKVTIRVYITRDITGMAGESFAVVANSGSYIQVDTSATTPPTNKQLLVSFRVPAGGTNSIGNPDPSRIEFVITHGDYIIVTSEDSNTSVGATIELGEEI